ncbi:hypothetical protein DXG01_002150 [Tephrocybe rancida]|nr:hypothetical protein DXG01_002150 [Tephrocybe rancida]
MPDIQWVCNCTRYSGGNNVIVSRATYYNHRRFRTVLASMTTNLIGNANGTGTDSHSQESQAQLQPHTSLDESHLSLNDTDRVEDPNKRHRIGSEDRDTPPLPSNVDEIDTGCNETPPAEVEEEHDKEEDFPPPIDVPEFAINDAFVPRTEELRIALEFKKSIENASLDNGDLDAEQLCTLRFPPQHVPAIDNHHILLSLKLFSSQHQMQELLFLRINLWSQLQMYRKWALLQMLPYLDLKVRYHALQPFKKLRKVYIICSLQLCTLTGSAYLGESNTVPSASTTFIAPANLESDSHVPNTATTNTLGSGIDGSDVNINASKVASGEASGAGGADSADAGASGAKEPACTTVVTQIQSGARARARAPAVALFKPSKTSCSQLNLFGTDYCLTHALATKDEIKAAFDSLMALERQHWNEERNKKLALKKA